MLYLNNLVKSSTDISSIVATKYTIFDNLLHTTSITSFPATNSNLVRKSTVKYVYSFFDTLFTINFSVGVSVLFFILQHKSHLSIYFSISFITSSH